MSLEFLSPSAGALARSPMERQALAAGAELEERDGWNVAARFDGEEAERARCATSVGFADLSHLGKVEVQAADTNSVTGESLVVGRVSPFDGGWWCPFTPERVLAIGELNGVRERIQAGGDGLVSVTDVTTAFGVLAVEGPLAREVFARFTALDLRDAVAPVGAFRPGSVARTPGAVLRETDDRWLMLFGSALGQYVWTVVADAALYLGGGPVGVDALQRRHRSGAGQPAPSRTTTEVTGRA